jgi:hypothetical protein
MRGMSRAVQGGSLYPYSYIYYNLLIYDSHKFTIFNLNLIKMFYHKGNLYNNTLTEFLKIIYRYNMVTMNKDFFFWYTE